MFTDSAPEAPYSSGMLPLQVIHQNYSPFCIQGPQDSGMLLPPHQFIFGYHTWKLATQPFRSLFEIKGPTQLPVLLRLMQRLMGVSKGLPVNCEKLKEVPSSLLIQPDLALRKGGAGILSEKNLGQPLLSQLPFLSVNWNHKHAASEALGTWTEFQRGSKETNSLCLEKHLYFFVFL